MRTKSLRFKLIIFEVVVLVLIVITASGILIETRENIYEQNNKYLNEILEKTSQNIYTRFNVIENILFSTSISSDVKNFILAKSKLEQVEASRLIDKYLVPMQNIDEKIIKIGLIGINGDAYNAGIIQEEQKKLLELIEKMEKNVNPQFLGIINTYGSQSIVIGNKIYDQRNGDTYSEIIGTVFVLIDDSIFKEELVSKEFNTDFVIANQYDNYVIWSEGKYEIGNVLDLNDNNLIINEVHIPNTNLKIVSINTSKQLFKDINQTFRLYFIIIGFMVLIPVSSYVFISNSLLKPLNNLSDFINQLTSGDLRNLKKRISITGSIEVERIAREINDLLNEVNDLTERLMITTSNLYGAEAEKSKAELEFLKSQINPHFLYNTLGMIKGIAVIKKEKEIANISSCLAKIFNYSIKGSDYIKLKEEVEITKAYIYIQQSRFRDRFEVIYNFSDEVLEANLMKFLFQPIIENAVFHGIEPTSKKCQLEMGGKITRDNMISLWVFDNGIGMNNEKLSLINERLKEGHIWQKEHVGIININARIKLAYGKEYGIFIESVEGEGTSVFINLPYRQA